MIYKNIILVLLFLFTVSKFCAQVSPAMASDGCSLMREYENYRLCPNFIDHDSIIFHRDCYVGVTSKKFHDYVIIDVEAPCSGQLDFIVYDTNGDPMHMQSFTVEASFTYSIMWSGKNMKYIDVLPGHYMYLLQFNEQVYGCGIATKYNE